MSLSLKEAKEMVDPTHGIMSANGEAENLVDGSTLSANPKDRPYSPAMTLTIEEDGTAESHKQASGSEIQPGKDYNSLDYDICYNIPYKGMIKKFTKMTYIHMEVMRWILVGIIGLLTGLVAAFIDICVRELFKGKFTVFNLVFKATIDEGQVIVTFLVLVGFNLLFALIAAILIAIEPVAAGSGIPEIKCYLNGVKVPRVTRLLTLMSKAMGVLFSVAGGIFVGKEGPMIHSGAILGAGIPQFKSFVFKKIKLKYHYFRSDRNKRDFVSSGAAAGVAAAFGAPIGGVLFSLERGSSFWNQALTWRTLFCSFSATFTLNFILSAFNGDEVGFLNSPGLVDFGIFSKEKHLWNAYHLLIFIVMGAVGGLFGALFNDLNVNLTKYRMKYLDQRIRNRGWRILEVLLIALVTTAGVFTCSMLLGTCLHKNHIAQSITFGDSVESTILIGDTSFVNATHNNFCPGYGPYKENHVYYNDMATLMFNSQEVAIKQLFHHSGAFTLSTLGIFFMLYFFVSCWTYGAGISSGLFIPCLVIGASYGRFVATCFELLSTLRPDIFSFLTNISSGTYALIGAAAFLGGVVRMTISLTVILIESTNEISYGLPIMITLMVAKWVGDLFNKGIYDEHIDLKNIPFLEWESPQQMDRLTAKDVMSSSRLSYLFPITRVRSVIALLKTTAHSGFLVVSPAIPGERLMKEQKHMAQLYTQSFMSDTNTETDSDQDIDYRNGGQVHVSTNSRADDLTGTFTVPTLMSAATNGEVRPLIMRGIITRSQLNVLLKNRVFFNEGDGPQTQPKVDQAALSKDYPRYPSVYEVSQSLTETERQMLMDISLYMNPCPYTISQNTPLPQIFNLFRTMGLRHLPVLEESGLLAGIITRHDLTHDNLLEINYQKKRRERMIWA